MITYEALVKAKEAIEEVNNAPVPNGTYMWYKDVMFVKEKGEFIISKAHHPEYYED